MLDSSQGCLWTHLNPAFDVYAVQVGPKTGVRFIKAATDNIATNVYGHELKSKFDLIHDKF